MMKTALFLEKNIKRCNPTIINSLEHLLLYPNAAVIYNDPGKHYVMQTDEILDRKKTL